MAQEYIKINDVKIKQPDTGLGYSFETTYTSDSTRVQSGAMHATPMFTVGVNAEWVKIGSSSLPDSIDDLSSQLSVMLESFTSQFSRQQDDISGLRTDLTTMQQNADQISMKVQEIIDDGVSKVTTETGATLGKDGLHITKSGEEMESRIDYSGLHVERNDVAILEATAAGAEAENVKVRTYLIVGQHARFEDYANERDANRTACYYI